MENQDTSAGAQPAATGIQSADAGYSLHKLQKRERRLLERLREAQEAEARALERFQRAQAKLERRKTRIQRLEYRLSRIKEELTGEEVPPPAEQIEQSVELTTNGYQPGEQVPDSLLSTAPIDTPVPPASESSAIEEDTLKPEQSSAPESAPSLSPEPLPENELSPAPELSTEEDHGEPTEEPSPASQPSAEEDHSESVAEATLAPEPSAQEDHSEPNAEPALVPEPSTDEHHSEPNAEPALAVEPSIEENHEEYQSEPAAEPSQAPAYDEEEPVEDIAPPPSLSGPQEVESTGERDIQLAQYTQPVQTISLASLEQALIEAREELQMVEASVDLAQRRRDELAKSISFLAQANLSGALMDELLHKQAEANRAWHDAKEQEHIARNRLARAEAAFYEAQS